jgi:hypothetical protein
LLTLLSKTIERKIINDILFIVLKIPQKMLKDLKESGSYVFLREYHSPYFFNVFISVMYVDDIKKLVKFGIKIKGSKTKLIRNYYDKIYIRGSYWNGMFGAKYIKQAYHLKCLIILSGMTQASDFLVIDKLLRKENIVTVLIDKSDYIFGKEYINKNVKIFEENLLTEEGQKFMEYILWQKN